MKKIKILLMAGVLAVSSIAGVQSVFAEVVSQSLTVSPPTQRMILTPGESYSSSLRISNANSSTRDLKYAVMVGSFSETGGEDSKDDYGTVDHVSVSSYNQIMDWISFDKESGTVAPNTTDILTYTIDVPENAPAGGQYATIIIRDVTGEGEANDGNVAISSIYQFASIIYAEVAGETKETGAILENSVPMFSFSAPFVASSIVENSGNVHVDAKYTLEIHSLFSGEEVYSNADEPMSSLILPETKRYNTQSWDGAPAFGVFRVKQTVSIFGDESVVERVVIMCPLWLLLVIVFVVVALTIWIIMKIGLRKRSGRVSKG